MGASSSGHQTDCGNPDSDTTSGLVAYLDGEPDGWCAVEPRTAYQGLVRNNREELAGLDVDRPTAVLCGSLGLLGRLGLVFHAPLVQGWRSGGWWMGADLLGREREMAALAGWFDEALEGHPRVVLCRGEPGIGKTRLAEEFSAFAKAKDALVAWGLGVHDAGAPPYWPWRQVLRAASADVDVQAIADALWLTGDVARLAPDVFAGSGRLMDGDGPAKDRFRQFDAVGRLLRQVAVERPLVVVLDDAH